MVLMIFLQIGSGEIKLDGIEYSAYCIEIE
jgi:hypothetical protein